MLNITNTDGNPFLNFLYQSAVELPAYLLARLSCDKLGRRLTASSSFALGMIAATALFFIVNGKKCILGITNIIYNKNEIP